MCYRVRTHVHAWLGEGEPPRHKRRRDPLPRARQYGHNAVLMLTAPHKYEWNHMVPIMLSMEVWRLQSLQGAARCPTGTDLTRTRMLRAVMSDLPSSAA